MSPTIGEVLSEPRVGSPIQTQSVQEVLLQRAYDLSWDPDNWKSCSNKLFSYIQFYYLFIYGCAESLLLWELFSSFREQGLLSICRARASHCGGFSLQGTGSRAHRLQKLWLPGSSTGSIVVAHTWAYLLHSMWDPPHQWSNLCLLHWQADTLPLSHQGSSSSKLLMKRKEQYVQRPGGKRQMGLFREWEGISQIWMLGAHDSWGSPWG